MSGGKAMAVGRTLGARLSKILLILLLALLAAEATLIQLGIISDPDFFWHLKSGEWIADHRALPERDPFAFTASAVPDTRQHFILVSYWLAQLLYHGVHAVAGFGGIVTLRLLLMAALLLAIRPRRPGCDPVVPGLLLIAVAVLRIFPFERPQVFSFIGFAVLLALLKRLTTRDAEAPPAWTAPLVPAVMFLWANLHGGHILGQATIVLWVGMELLRLAHPRLSPLPPTRLKPLLLSGGAGLLAALLNPGFMHAWGAVSLPSWVRATNAEYQSTLTVFAVGHDPAYLLHWLLLLAAGLLLATAWREADPAEALLLLTLGWLSFREQRYIPFFLVVAVPFVAGRLARIVHSSAAAESRLSADFSSVGLLNIGSTMPAQSSVGKVASQRPLSRLATNWCEICGLARTRWRMIAVGLVVAVGLVAGSWTAWNARANFRNLSLSRWTSFNYPAEAADFILARGLEGRMFNFYDWGGYLIWRLAPERPVFTDGRNLEWEVNRLAESILNGSEMTFGGEPLWRAGLDRFAVAYTVTPVYSIRGEIFGLVDRLVADPGWNCAFIGYNSVIFVRGAGGNAERAGVRHLPPGDIWRALLAMTDGMISLRPTNAAAQSARRGILARLESVP